MYVYICRREVSYQDKFRNGGNGNEYNHIKTLTNRKKSMRNWMFGYLQISLSGMKK